MRRITRSGLFRRFSGQGGSRATTDLPPVVTQALLAVAENQRLRRRRAMADGGALPEGAMLRAARRSGVHPSADPIGQRARAALRAWSILIGGETPEVIAAWSDDDKATILLAGLLNPRVGLPDETVEAAPFRVHFRPYRPARPEGFKDLVFADVAGLSKPSITPDHSWGADGLLLPFGWTRAGIFYLPLLGPFGAGSLALDGAAAGEFLASLLVFALARVGAQRIRALAYEGLHDLVRDFIDADAFGPADLETIRKQLEEEWKTRSMKIGAAGAGGFQSYALGPESEPIPLLVLLLGPQAATELGLLNEWPYVLREAARVGIAIIIWGDIETAPRRIEVGPRGATATFAAFEERERIGEIEPIEFAPLILSPETRSEAVAILRASAPGSEREEKVSAFSSSMVELMAGGTPTKEAETKLTVEMAQPVERGIYLLGGVRLEHAGQTVEGWRRRDAAELLAFLAAYPEGRSADAVMEAIWPEAHATRARAHLRQLVREARVRLAGELPDDPVVVVRDGVYRLDWEGFWADVQAFRQAVSDAAEAPDPEPYLREAVTLYRGEFCKDTYYSWVDSVRYEAERAYIDAATRLTDLLLERGAFEDAHRTAEKALVLNPYVDALVQRAMVLDARRFGKRAAEERLRTFRARLREDLDADADPATVGLLERLV